MVNAFCIVNHATCPPKGEVPVCSDEAEVWSVKHLLIVKLLSGKVRLSQAARDQRGGAP